MRHLHHILALLIILLHAANVSSENSVRVAETDVIVSFYSPTTVRIQKLSSRQASQRKSLVVTAAPDNSLSIKRSENGSSVSFSSPSLSVSVNKKSGLVSFKSGSIVLSEKNFSLSPRSSGPDADAFKVTTSFALRPGEKIYGLGTLQNGRLSRNDTDILIEQSNLEDFQNVIQSINGWGLFWDNYSRTHFVSSSSDFLFDSEVGDGVDYFFLASGSADKVIADIRHLSGRQPMFPLWTFGYWQSKERYKSEAELVSIVRRYRDAGVPLDGIIQDWQYWGSNYTWNAMEFISDDFPHADKMIADIHDMNAHVMLSIWSNFGPMTKQFHELDSLGLLFDFETWPQSGLNPWPPRMDYPSGVRVYDVFSPVARDIYCRYLRHLFDLGIDAWWMDSTDPDYKDPKDSDYDHSAGDGTWRRYRNAFPLEAVHGVYDAQRQWSDRKRVFIMTRSAFAGQQRYGSGLWSGDVQAAWDVLRAQIPLGLNYSLTGCPNFNTDIGGFFAHDYCTHGSGSAPRNPQYQELYLRWMQYALFNPVFRSHGTSCAKEVWEFGRPGDKIYDAIVAQIRFRYRLMPYLYTLAWEATSADASYMRPLFADFPADKKTHDLAHEFLFGKSILAAPVVHAEYTPEKIDKSKPSKDNTGLDGWNNASSAKGSDVSSYAPVDFSGNRSRLVYLPKGADWYDFWTGSRFRGGQEVSVSTPIENVPMFVRAGGIIPLGPEMNFVGEKSWQELEIRLFPGADGNFNLYEDEGDNYNYEQGKFSIIPLVWHDKSRTLTIGDRKGSFDGMINNRSFKVVLPGGKSSVISYDGTQKSVKL